MFPTRRLAPLVLSLALAACATASPPAVRAPTAMVAAANPMAVDAGLKVLADGGSAVDAAVAVQAVLGLVEPQSSGLGGGAFMTYYDARARKVTAYDGREQAPAGATPDMFLDDTGKPLPRAEAMLSGRATGAPGAVAMLAMAQRDHGKLAWKDLFGEAERLARDGFPAPVRMAAAAANPRIAQARTPDALAYLTRPDGRTIQPGDVVRNPAYAQSARRIAEQGPDGLLRGPLADAIVARVQAPPRPGALSLEDLAAYRPKVSAALCRPYRTYVVCAPPPPSGGSAVLQALGILEHTDITAHGPADPQGWYLFSQAGRLMYADRDAYVGDPAFVDVPTEGMLDPAYVAARAKLIGPVAGPPPEPGRPPGAPARAPDTTREPAGTSHFVIVDKAGDVVSMTTTVESAFGSGRMAGGFFLNNQMTDFAFTPTRPDGTPAANAVQPRKRPRSSMAPLIVLDRQGRFVAAVGSPGGPAILAYNLKVLVGVLDWKLSMQAAIELPNLIPFGRIYAAETDRFAPGVIEGLAAKGVTLVPSEGAEGSGLHGVEVTPKGLRGGVDPRREGAAKGL